MVKKLWRLSLKIREEHGVQCISERSSLSLKIREEQGIQCISEMSSISLKIREEHVIQCMSCACRIISDKLREIHIISNILSFSNNLIHCFESLYGYCIKTETLYRKNIKTGSAA